MPVPRSIVTRRRIARVLAVAALVVTFVNAVAYMHAYRMTHFQSAGERTGSVQELSLLDRAAVLLTGVSLPRPVNTRTPGDGGFCFETLTISSTGGVTLEAWHVPAVEPRGVVALFHGYASAKSALLDEAAAFRELGFGALMVDFRGSGGSTGNETTIGFEEAEDVAAAERVARELARGGPVVLFAQSMGAAAVLRAVATGMARPDALVLESPFDRMLTTVGHRFHLMGLPAFPAANLLVFWGGVQHGFDGFGHNPVDYARRVRCPTLLMQGARDPFVTPSEGRAVAEALAGPKRFELFDDAGHEPCLGADAGRWRALVSDLFQSR